MVDNKHVLYKLPYRKIHNHNFTKWCTK